MAQRGRRGELSGLALLAAGFALVAAVVAGYFIGAHVDRIYGTGPRWMLVGLLLGFIIGIWDLYLIASRLLAIQPKIDHPAETQDWAAPAGDRDEDRESYG